MRIAGRIRNTALVLLVAVAGVTEGALEPVRRTQDWANSDSAFAVCEKRIARMKGRNLLRRSGVKFVDTGGLGFGTTKMLFDGTGGVRVSTGRVGLNGKPTALTFYLGEPKVISQVGVFTFNSDARANQDFEVRFASGAARPGTKPEFPDLPHLTTGPTILGANTGGFHTYFRSPGGGALTAEPVDWVQFRFWPTYNQKTGAPGKAAGKASGWSSLIELEVLGDEADVIWIPDDDFAEREQVVRDAASKGVEKLGSWHESLAAARKAVEGALVAPAAGTPFEPFVSKALRPGDAPRRIDISVAGLKRLWLEVAEPSAKTRGPCALWGDPVLVSRDGAVTPLGDLKPLYSTAAARDMLKDKGADGKPLALTDRALKRGLCVPAPSRVCYPLDGKYDRFQAWAGLSPAADKRVGVAFCALSLPSAEDAMSVVWERVRQLFGDAVSRREMAWEEEDGIWDRPPAADNYAGLAQRYAAASHRHPPSRAAATACVASVEDAAGLQKVRTTYYHSRRIKEALDAAAVVPLAPLRLAVEDLRNTFGDRYPDGEEFLRRISRIEQGLEEALGDLESASKPDVDRHEQIAREARELQREALLANPLLAFDDLLFVRRKADRLGMPANWQSNSSIPKTGYDNEMARLSISEPERETKTLYRPQKGEYVGDVDLHFDADRVLFSMPNVGSGSWHVYELRLDGTGPRQVTQTKEPGVNNYDACYLPDDGIVFTSTAGMVAVPCVRGSAPVATLFRMDADGSGMRQLCFDQEHSWYPAVMHDGRVLYTRWEYADLPHSNSRMLFTANPDGTNQRSYYGSNSFWPNSIFYARPVPGHATKVVGTITGHHAPARMGELLVFDPAVGTREADGVVQRIPGYGKPVEPLIRDGLTGGSWPKFLHPFPLSEHHFLVSAKPTKKSNWGIYLVDVFDNMLLIREEPGYALLEPVPLQKVQRPPVIPERINLDRSDSVVVISDIYSGPGLKGIPRGEVKRLRVYTYTFGYPGVGGLYGSIGMDGPWDMRRTLGTVPIEADGSAMFRVPANTPIAIQPLDSEGKALQIMRSWFTAMPGETLSCIGCHEGLDDAPPVVMGEALRKEPNEIVPWRGEARNYEFQREVQPVLDRFCVGCHDGSAPTAEPPRPDLRGTVMLSGWSSRMHGNTGKGSGGRFSVAYANLHRYVRRPGIESPMPLMTPMEFHADTTELVQMLDKGHHDVVLNEEAWDRLVTWIDFNAPYHGRWSTIVGKGAKAKEAVRARLRDLYANVNENHEVLPDAPAESIKPVLPPKREVAPGKRPQTKIAGWPFGEDEARRRQAKGAGDSGDGPGRAGAGAVKRLLDLGQGVTMELVYVPPGEFIMGSDAGYADEAPHSSMRIDEGFWMGRLEVSNAQFRQFDPSHDSGQEDRHGYQFGIPGYDVNLPDMPAVRLSWREAMGFCEWLSKECGRKVALPTEAQWEWACRAGTATPFFFGGSDDDFAPYANLGDAMLADFSGNPYVLDPAKARYGNPENPFDNWIPQDARFNDGGFVSEPVGKYKPNPWGLHDMHGNVAEWTLSRYVPYPYKDDGRNAVAADGKSRRVMRGGSWYDRPKRATSSYRYGYRDYQKAYNVGFRVVVQSGRDGTRRVAVAR